MKNLILLMVILNCMVANSLQDAINSAKNGDIIELGSGEFQGDILINKSLTLIGNNTTIKGSGKENVIKITAPNVTLKNLNVQGSGNSHTTIDSAISCEDAYNIKIINCNITDSLFGINFKQCNSSLIKENNITSKKVSLGLRGDAIRLWYSHNNKILDNYIYDSRDLIVWYSSGNLIQNNIAKGGRYALHFMYAGRNLVFDNKFSNNSVGVFFMFSKGSEVKRNFVASSTGAFGLGFGMKDTSDFLIEDNIIMYNARGLYIDNSPYEPGTTNTYRNNQILYNTFAVQTQSVQLPSIFENNNFIGNMNIMLTSSSEKSLSNNSWNANFYDEYQGFDRDKNGYGDTPFQNYAYADMLWQAHPNLQFFYGTVAISSINFLAKLAPFSEPMLLLEDKNPRIKPLEFNYE